MSAETLARQSAPPASADAVGRNVVARLLIVQSDELRALLWACAYAFAVLAFNYVLRPLRDEIGVGESKRLAWSYTGTFLVTIAVNPVFSALVTWFPRRTFIALAHRICAALLLIGFGLRQIGPAWLHEGAGWSLFAWISTFNLLAVSLVWSLMADVFDHARAKRLFGLIGVGATLGGIGGSLIVANLKWTPFEFVLVAIACLELANYFARRTAACAPGAASAPETAVVKAQNTEKETLAVAYAAQRTERAELARGGVWGGITRAFASPYLLGIGAYLLLLTITATFTYFEQARIVGAVLPERGDQRAYFARTDLYVNTLCLGAQIFAMGRLLRRFGAGPLTTVLPITTAVGFALLALPPGGALLPILFWFQVARRTADYAVSRPAREVLFTVVRPDEKYKAKNFLDTVLYRGGDLCAAWISYFFHDWGNVGIEGLAILVVVLCVVWTVLGLVLGQAAARRAGNQASTLQIP